jgi:Integrase core domain
VAGTVLKPNSGCSASARRTRDRTIRPPAGRERFQQTLKRWLDAQPAPRTITELQTRLDAFTAIYNQQRPHRSLPHRATPATIYTARPKGAAPTNRDDDTHHRVRHDRVDLGGTITLRVHGRLHHIGIGRTHARTHVVALHIRIVNAATGELLRELTIDPTRNYQPTGKPKGPTRPKDKRPGPN